MDEERFQQMEKRLNEQVEATRAINETLNKFLAVMANQEVARNVAPPPLASPLPVTTPLKASHPTRVDPGAPSNFDGDRAQGCAFLTSCELYISLSQADFVEDQVQIHWALSYFKGRHTATFAEHVISWEMRSGKMCFASCDKFREEFTVAFCPENEATTALMRLESDRYFQGKHNVEVYIDEFKDLVDLSGYTDPITIVLKFRRGLNTMTPSALPRTPFSFLRSQAPPTAATPAAMHTPLRALPPGVPMDVDRTRTFKPITQTCHHCGQTGHFSKECHLWHDVHHMTLDEEDEYIQHILANRDAAMAAAARSTTNTATSEGTLVEWEVGFCQIQQVNSTSPLSSYNRFACLEVDTPIEPFTCAAESTEVVPNPSHPPIPN
jgi:hypothetical protein